MVFIPEQNGNRGAIPPELLLRLKPCDEAEAVLTRCSGQIFTGKLTSILPTFRWFLSGAGRITVPTVVPGTDGVLTTIELDPNADVDALPDGIYARVAVYSDHCPRVGNAVLLRMTSWMR